MYFVRFAMPSCSPERRSGNQRLVSEGTATHNERFGRKTGGGGLGMGGVEESLWSVKGLDGGMTIFDTGGMTIFKGRG